jgi:hypothetical protein
MALVAPAGPYIPLCSARPAFPITRNRPPIPSALAASKPETPPAVILDALRVPPHLLHPLRRSTVPYHGLCWAILAGPGLAATMETG